MDGLKESAVVAAGLESHAFQFRSTVMGGNLVSASAGAAALEQIVGEEAYVRT